MGMKYVYVGNVHDIEGQTTYCPSCKTHLIQRDWHSVRENRMNKNKCSICNTIISGIFTKKSYTSDGLRYGVGLS
jgi:pyruvate formate lyase activating enzyme